MNIYKSQSSAKQLPVFNQNEYFFIQHLINTTKCPEK